MVGGGIKRDDGLPAISSTNIFSALESRRRKSSKKRSDKEKSDSGSVRIDTSHKEQAPQVWTPTPVSVTSWADCEDDDDYFATPALPPPVWTSDQPSENAGVEQDDLSQGEESEGDEEVEEEGDEENEDETETDVIEPAGDVNVVPTVSAVAREPDRQLSKKEMKRRELAELEAVLAELGYNQKDEKDTSEYPDDKKEGEANEEADGEVENIGSGPTLTESKSSKRRKAKKVKSFKEGREEEAPLDTNGSSKDDPVTDDVEANSGPADRKEVLKRIASMKKKKSSKESDAAAKAAASEAAARAAKLAAAKKKEKNHYNQQPVR